MNGDGAFCQYHYYYDYKGRAFYKSNDYDDDADASHFRRGYLFRYWVRHQSRTYLHASGTGYDISHDPELLTGIHSGHVEAVA